MLYKKRAATHFRECSSSAEMAWAFFDRKILGRLLKAKMNTAILPPIGYRVPVGRHWFVQAQRNGGSENQSRRFKWAC